MYPKILKNFIYPFIEIKYPREEKIINNLRLLNKTQWWDSSELERFQQKRLRSLLNHAYKNVPYYHKTFDQLGLKPQNIKNVDDLQQLPILTKETIRNNFNDLIAKNYSKAELIPSATGGSTGEPMRFFIDRKWTSWNTAAALRQWAWSGYNIGDKIAYLWSAPQDISYQVKFRTKIQNLMRRTVFLDALNMDEETLDEYLRILRTFKPKIINAYVSAIYLMAQYLEKRGIEDIRPKSILTSCEMLFDNQRKLIEKEFGCEIFDYYSGRDTTLHAGECPEHSGYHLAIENAVIEFIRDGKHVASGEQGKLIITDFNTYAMPFIRYEIGDLGVPSDETCSCGRGLPLMESIVGRTTDIIVKPNGGYVSTPYLTVALADFENIRKIQIIQKTKENVTLKVIKGKKYTDEDSKLLKALMKRHLGNEMNIEISFVDSIPPTKSGKYRFIISEVKKNI